MKEETLDKIDRYLREEMTESDKRTFENILAGDNALRQRVERMREIVDAVETRGMKAHLAALDEVRHKRKKVYWVGGFASALAACLLLAFFLRIGNDHLMIPVSVPSDFTYERGGGYMQDVAKLLNHNQYDKALLLIDSLETEYKSEDSLLLAKKKWTEEEIYVRQSDSIALYQLSWLRIQAFIGKKKYDEVRELLKQYRLQEGDYRNKADSLWILLK